MTGVRIPLLTAAGLGVTVWGWGCKGSRSMPDQMVAESLPSFEAPVLTNPESPVSYPVDLFEQRVEGTVVLRLFLDERGNVVPESTRISEGSGYGALDTAALQGIVAMRFAPARRSGRPVPTTFLQPIHFRRPEPKR